MSSSMVYESATEWPSVEGSEREIPPPLSSYGFQKLAVEYYAKAAWDQHRLPFTIARPFNCVGIGERRALGDEEILSGNVKLAMSHVVPDLVQKVLKGQDPLHILGTGEQIRHYTYGGDLARGIITAMDHPDAINEDFNLSTAESTSVPGSPRRSGARSRAPTCRCGRQRRPVRVRRAAPRPVDRQGQAGAGLRGDHLARDHARRSDPVDRAGGRERDAVAPVRQNGPWRSATARFPGEVTESDRSVALGYAGCQSQPVVSCCSWFIWPGNRVGRPSAADPLVRRRPWWVWAAPFALMLTLLLARNAFLFTSPEYEDADMAANSILIEQARRFTLLVGNYSREGFNHPGPAFLYVESWGESLFYDALHLVPTAWNGQLIGLYLLNAGFASGLVAVVYGWTRSLRGVLAAARCWPFRIPAPGRVQLGLDAVRLRARVPHVRGVARFRVGRARRGRLDRDAVGLVPHPRPRGLPVLGARMAAVPVAVRAWPALRSARDGGLPCAPGGASGCRPSSSARPSRCHWSCRLALLGPGNFEAYLAYQSSGSAGGHTPAEVAGYVLWFWWPHANAWAAPLILALAAGLLTWRLPSGPARRFCWSLLLVDALSVVAVTGYVVVGVDSINQYYICYFSWANPVVLLLVIVIAAAELIARPAARSPSR